jgi:lipopolysaccharide transport system permease protein
MPVGGEHLSVSVNAGPGRSLVDRTLRKGSARFFASHGRLLWRVTRNEMAQRYAGSHLGSMWVLLAPVFILVVYAITYVVILKVKIGGLSAAEYVIFIFAGLVPYLMCAEALVNGTSSVVANKSVLSNTVFPIDLAPVKAVVTSQAIMVAGLAITIVGSAVAGSLHWTIVLLPVIWLLQVVGLVGLVWLLSLLNVIFRDIQNFLQPLLMMMLIMSPIVYLPAMVPDSLKALIVLNPFAYFVIAYQKVIVLGAVPHAGDLALMFVMSGALFLLGSWFFASAKRVIIDYV